MPGSSVDSSVSASPATSWPSSRFCLTYLNNLETLALDSVSNVASSAPAAHPDDSPLRLLRRLEVSLSRQALGFILQHFPLPNLITLDLNHYLITQATPSLPSLPSLRSLRLTTSVIPPEEIEPPSFVVALPSTSISHLSLGRWPTPALLSSLPSTIELLDFNINGDLSNATLPHPLQSELPLNLADVPRGKAARFPALRAVRIRVDIRVVASASLARERTRRQLVAARVPALVDEIKDFRVVTEDEEWRSFLPAEWE